MYDLDPIYDPFFKTGDSALFHYGESDTIMVQIHSHLDIDNTKWYAVSANKALIKHADVVWNNYLTCRYKDKLQDQHLVFIAEPDELEYPTQHFMVVKDNKGEL